VSGCDQVTAWLLLQRKGNRPSVRQGHDNRPRWYGHRRDSRRQELPDRGSRVCKEEETRLGDPAGSQRMGVRAQRLYGGRERALPRWDKPNTYYRVSGLGQPTGHGMGTRHRVHVREASSSHVRPGRARLYGDKTGQGQSSINRASPPPTRGRTMNPALIA
jgi:hypothetical protein